MDEQKDLTLVIAKVIATRPTYLDGDEHWVHTEFQNNTGDAIEITRAACAFQTEVGHPKYTETTSRPCTIPPGGIGKIKIPFKVDLTMTADTNHPSIEVEYPVGGSTKATTFNMPIGCHTVIQRIPYRDQYFFISHKDPENTIEAKSLNYYLEKIGFSGYLAEDNRQPGLDLWHEKILPAIEKCAGLIAIWTEKAAQQPEAMLREIEYAQEKNKRIILLVEKDLDIPDILKGQNEYADTKGRISKPDLVKLVEEIHQMYMGGSFSLS